jgi:hypothetical protein
MKMELKVGVTTNTRAGHMIEYKVKRKEFIRSIKEY